MKLEEAIKHAKDVATKKYRQAMLHRANAEDEKYDKNKVPSWNGSNGKS